MPSKPLKEDYKLKGLRKRLVDLLREKGIGDQRVLDALMAVKRHAFIESAFAEKAYQDIPLPIGDGQTISQPYTVAYMTQALQLQPGHRVLEIGTGSGYQAAILAEMGAVVFSIERQEMLFKRTKQLLAELGYEAHLKLGDGTRGWAKYAPYDGIIVTAGGPSVPPSLQKQLAVGGRMLIPVGDRESQKLLEVTRTSERHYTTHEHADFRFVPLIGEEGW